MTPTYAYALLVLIAVLTFAVSGFWWLSGFGGASRGKAGPIAVTLLVTAIAGGAMYYAGWIP